MKSVIPLKEVQVRIARCGKCNNIVFASVVHMMDRQSHKELLDCVKLGCDVTNMPLLEFRKLNGDWCNAKCKEKPSNTHNDSFQPQSFSSL